MEYKRILTVLAILLVAAPLALAQTTIDNFEDGDFSSNPAWTSVENAGGTQAVTTQQAYNGLNSVRLTTDGSNDNAYNRLETALDSAFVYDGDKAVMTRMLSDTTGQSRKMVTLFTSTNDRITAGLDSNGNFSIEYTNDNTTTYSSSQYEADTWYNVRMLPNENDNTATVRITNQQGSIIHQDTGTFTGTVSSIQLMTQDTSSTATSNYFDYLTYNETSFSDFDFRLTSASTTASNGSDSLYFSINDMHYPSGVADGSSGETGYFSLAAGSVSTVQFEINSVSFETLVYPNENNQPSKATVGINYTVVSSEGFSGVTNSVNLQGQVTRTGTCSFTSVGPESRAYNCTVEMEYFDPADTYDVNITYTANAETISYFNADAFTYGELVASQRTGDTLSFNNAGPGKTNVRSDQQISLKNTGNAPLNMTITAYDLQSRNDPTVVIDASNFKSGNASVSTAATLANANPVQVHANLGGSQSQSLWFWLTMPSDVPPSDYYSPNSWQIQGVS